MINSDIVISNYIGCSGLLLLLLAILLDECENLVSLLLVGLLLLSLLPAALAAQETCGSRPVEVHADAAWH